MSSPQAAIELLIAQPDRLERGLVVLDSHLPLDEEIELDVLMRDSLGYPVVVLFTRAEVTAELGRVASVVSALHRSRHLLGRMFGERGLDPTLRPRFVMLAPRFHDEAAVQLDLLSSIEIMAMEYRVISDADGRPVLDLAMFHRTQGPALTSRSLRRGELSSAAGALSAVTRTRPAARPTRVSKSRPAATRPAATTSEPTSSQAARSKPSKPAAAGGEDELQLVDEAAPPDVARGYFLRAREAIRSLASHITENAEDGLVRFRVEDELLATLRLDQKGFFIQVGDGAGDGVAVMDDSTFNERLNAVFVLYFSRMGPELPVE
jgi:hypothetical protein